MGRGRAKAKQTKVARDLKYRTHETDFDALARELHGEDGQPPPAPPADGEDADELEKWAEFADPSSPNPRD